jgi:hypothetical protein
MGRARRRKQNHERQEVSKNDPHFARSSVPRPRSHAKPIHAVPRRLDR